MTKVRHGLVHVALDVPENNFLEGWANTAFKPLAGWVVFYQTKGGAARETLSWEAGNCVSYHESFQSGSRRDGSYVCFVDIVAPKLVLTPGGSPRPFVAPAPRDYAYVPPPAQFIALAVNIAKPYVGGRGPNGFGDTRGEHSHRMYDADNCGGTIKQLDWRTVEIKATGVATVAKHINRFVPVAANQKMIMRLTEIAGNKLVATDYDKRYYTHELREYERYQALKIPDGHDPGYEVWNNAHSAALEDYQINEREQPLYHPDITEEDF